MGYVDSDYEDMPSLVSSSDKEELKSNGSSRPKTTCASCAEALVVASSCANGPTRKRKCNGKCKGDDPGKCSVARARIQAKARARILARMQWHRDDAHVYVLQIRPVSAQE